MQLEIIKLLVCSYELNIIPDIIDDLTRKERITFYCLNQLLVSGAGAMPQR
jgi:hypothetical protein